MYPHEVICPICGKKFTALQPTARFDKPSCRQKAYYLKKMYGTKEPIPGLSPDAAAAYDDLYRNASPLAVTLIKRFREARGARIAAEAIYIALATCRPDLIDPGLETGRFHYENLPEKLKGMA